MPVKAPVYVQLPKGNNAAKTEVTTVIKHFRDGSQQTAVLSVPRLVQEHPSLFPVENYLVSILYLEKFHGIVDRGVQRTRFESEAGAFTIDVHPDSLETALRAKGSHIETQGGVRFAIHRSNPSPSVKAEGDGAMAGGP